MPIYLGRHGVANRDSTLSKQGEIETTHIASLLQKNSVAIKQIYHSEKERAIQTATIYADHLNLSPHLLPTLNPSAPIEPLLDSLEEHALYIGHLPNIEALASHLLLNSNAKLINFIPSTLLCLDKLYDNWHIEWIITPQLLRENV